MPRFDGMVALVVGGADNIGRATARLLAADGAQVAIGYHSNAEGADETVRLCMEHGSRAIAIQVDQADEFSVAAMVERTVAEFGQLDIVINNAAAISHSSQEKDGDVVHMDLAYWDQVMATNLRGPMLVCKHAIPHLIKSGRGAIVNTGSAIVLRGRPMLTAYSASKKALESLTMDIAATYGKNNVRCNLLVPGLVMSTIARERLSQTYLKQALSDMCVPFIGEPEDLANVGCFLASPEARYITGQVVLVDGGMHISASQNEDA